MMFRKKNPSIDSITVQEDWSISQGIYDENVIFIRINNGLRKLAGHPEYAHQVGIAVPLNNPNEHGLPESDEGEELGVIEEHLLDSLLTDNESLFVGAITTGGMREFVFYTSSPEQVVNKFKTIQKIISTHELQLLIQLDKDWRTFKNLLG
jgi:hypothetical protein